MKLHYEIAGAPRDSIRCSRDGDDGLYAWMTYRDNLKQALTACRENMRKVGAKSATVEIFYSHICETRNLHAAKNE